MSLCTQDCVVRRRVDSSESRERCSIRVHRSFSIQVFVHLRIRTTRKGRPCALCAVEGDDFSVPWELTSPEKPSVL